VKFYFLQTFIFLLLISSCSDTIRLNRSASSATSSSCSLPSGVLDTTFGTSGALTITNPLSYGSPNNQFIKSIYNDNSGSFFITGQVDNNLGTQNNMFIGKIDSSGQPDTSFGGGDGYLDKSVGSDTSAEERGNDIAVLSNGEIVVVGEIGATTSDFLISKWNSSGTTETASQSYDGWDQFAGCAESPGTIAPRDDGANALTVDDSDNLYITGFCKDDGNNENLLIMKTDNTGGLDGSFSPLSTPGVYNYGTNGDGSREVGNDIILLNSGAVIVAGTRLSGTTSDIILIKLTSTGIPDPSFGGGDGVVDDIQGQINSIVEDSNGNIYAVGRSHNGSDWDLTIWKFDSSGSLDTSLGSAGELDFDAGVTENEIGFDVKLSTSCYEHLIIFGLVHNDSSRATTTIWRYKTTGSLDTSFGSGTGYVVNDLISTQNNRANSGVITSESKYLTGGSLRKDTSDFTCLDSRPCDLYLTKWE
jgi:uncharacterized delta-60 repeat protein